MTPRALKTSIRDVRRRDLEEAALLTLQEYGFSGTTIARIAARLGMSPGIVHHYYRSKDELLEAAIRYANALLTREVIARLQLARTPRERLTAVIEGQFAEPAFTRGVTQAWVSFQAQVPFSPQFARINTLIQRRLRSNLMHALKDIMPREKAAKVAEEIAILIDGLWMRHAVKEGGITHEGALRLLNDYLDCALRDARERGRGSCAA
ncbi:MAG: transcriptional regulator BetI [Pseudomonadota bacterium]